MQNNIQGHDTAGGLDRVLVARGGARDGSRRHRRPRGCAGGATRRLPTRPPSTPCARSSARSTSAAASSSAKARWTRARCSTSARRSESATGPRSTSPSIRWRAPPSAPRPCRTRWPCWPSPSAAGCCNAPDMYMNKIAIGPGYPEGIIDLDAPTGRDAQRAWPRPRACRSSEITACILDRPRHAELIAAVRKAGAGVQLIPDGDIAGVIWTTDPNETGIDIYFGIGGAPEGVLAAAALRCIGGQMQGRLHPDCKEEERADRARRARWASPTSGANIP